MPDRDLFLPKKSHDTDVSPLRELMAQAGADRHIPLASLRAAQQDTNGIVILEGDDGGTIYVVCPARLVCCSEDVLNRLLDDIDAMVWREPDMAHVYFESRAAGSIVPGGMGGGIVTEDLWVHDTLQEVKEGIRAVITCERTTLNATSA